MSKVLVPAAALRQYWGGSIQTFAEVEAVAIKFKRKVGAPGDLIRVAAAAAVASINMWLYVWLHLRARAAFRVALDTHAKWLFAYLAAIKQTILPVESS